MPNLLTLTHEFIKWFEKSEIFTTNFIVQGYTNK
jgi:hypothetical protein